MSIKSIDPIYKKWVKEINASTISAKIEELNKEFTSIVSDILYSDESNASINKRIGDVRKRLLYTQLAYNEMPADSATTASLGKLTNSMNLVNAYEARETQKGQKKSLDILTYISIVILPLTLITGYFGMNFKSMGAPAKSEGILTLNWGQIFVFLLGASTVVVSILLLNHFYKVS